MSSRAMQFKAEIRNIAERTGISAQAVLQNFMLDAKSGAYRPRIPEHAVH